uniref:C2H2-type domain-containing protein n=1 Tax=Plectus sambesii TaxID=2011161 RepID=A0A914WPD5_9BILA
MNVHPKFAIVRLRPQDDVFTLFRLLIQHGYPEVSFVNGLREEAFLPRTSLLPSGERITPPPVDAAQSPAAVNAAGANGRPSGEHKGAAMTKDGGGIAMPSTVPTTVSAPLASLGLLGATGSFMSPLSGLPMTSEAQSSFAALANPSMFSSLTGVPTDLSGLLSAPLQLNGGGSNGNGSHSNGLSSMLQQPPSSQSPHNGSPSSTSTANTQLRQRGSRAQTDDPSVYAHCRLCQNKIMASRLSNLTNHVRRHASLKQFQCNYCDYTHNEMAKVRLHMLHNHKDKDSQPIDNLSPEMQAQWDFLMEQCFPQYNKDFFTKETGAHPAVVSSAMRISQVNIPTVTPSLSDLQRHYLKPTTQKVVAKTLSNSSEQLDEAHGLTCIECGELVSEQLLEHHLRHSHAADCIPYVCDECGYENSDQWKVRLHISLKHAEKAADIAVTAQNTANNYAAFISKFFPDYEHD